MSMLPFSGKGFLVPVVTFGTLVGTEWLVEAAFHDDQYYQIHGWPKGLALVLSAVAVAAVARSVEEPRSRLLIDPTTGQEVMVRFAGHHFLFIPLRYWPALLVLLGVVFSFVSSTGT